MAAPKGAQYALQHGGAGALNSIENKQEFIGLAKRTQDEVQARLDLTGIEGEIVRDAERLQVVSDLYYNAFIKAIESGDHEKAGAVLSKWGWIHNSTIRAWELARKLKRSDDPTEINKIIEQYREGNSA